MSDTAHLTEMLGRYFDRAWAEEQRPAEERLAQMLREVPPERQRRVASEIGRLLDGHLCENQVRDVLLYEIGCHYAFERDGLEASAWLQHVHDRIVRRPATDLSVARAVDSDLPAVMTLVDRCIGEMRRRGIDQWDDVYPTLDHFASDVSAGSLFVASVDGEEIAGVFTLDEHQDTEYREVPWAFDEQPVAVVHRLMVDPAQQGNGIARRLMRFAEGTATNLGYQVMRLDAFTLNPYALRLYRALGYRDAGEVTFRKGKLRCFEKRLGHRAFRAAGSGGDDD